MQGGVSGGVRNTNGQGTQYSLSCVTSLDQPTTQAYSDRAEGKARTGKLASPLQWFLTISKSRLEALEKMHISRGEIRTAELMLFSISSVLVRSKYMMHVQATINKLCDFGYLA